MDNNEELEKIKQENQRLNKALSESKKENIRIQNNLFIDELMGQGKLFPSQKDDALALLSLATDYDEGGVVYLNEGEKLADKVKALLDKLNIINLSMQTATLETPRKNTKWREEEKLSKDELDRKIQNFMRAYNLTYEQAFNVITREELAK
ncbi:hypothetical protein B0186_05350 [Canicola haemoglobinophilus]|uniref:Bacteriophage protein n=1 Tax=Canicola haemoglobinophilus TaxID=733 RepID=A0A1V4B1M6_9PAST|nr:hypothetical protein [Canicola haemoglobinophilus]OOS00997.1 hypothetical protein B0186_05350 [Canicola haemoglobinophilus]STO54906.1 putative bacteriophage protein [Canicola haemoglobinophilus]STO59177.1 putative bacteriophage protein [Canicola haemoglobinophilus]STO69523.1 putative bacteriophage protein [Canicola haemoglobinophilus]